MYLKATDFFGCTHLIECSSATYLGRDEEGHRMASGYDGPEAILNFDSVPTDELHPRYFVVIDYADPAMRRTVASIHARALYLLNPEGKTIENILAWETPPDVVARTS